MYQQKGRENYLIPLQFGLLTLLVLARGYTKEKTMIAHYVPVFLEMVLGLAAIAWLAGLQRRPAILPSLTSLRRAWRYRGDYMHGAMLPVRVVIPRE